MADWIDLVDKKKLIRNIHQILDKHINASAVYPAELFEIKRELLGSIDIEHSFITQDSGNLWISCSERLPEVDGREILLSHKNGEVYCGMFFEDSFELFDSAGELPEGECETSDILAWMPMPDAYKQPEKE